MIESKDLYWDETTQPLISVIIPVFNMEDTLNQCLDSVLNNTYRNIEVFCVDDGSTDSSVQILELIAGKDSRVRIIRKKMEGFLRLEMSALRVVMEIT